MCAGDDLSSSIGVSGRILDFVTVHRQASKLGLGWPVR
jgi:hypothetical protein